MCTIKIDNNISADVMGMFIHINEAYKRKTQREYTYRHIYNVDIKYK